MVEKSTVKSHPIYISVSVNQRYLPSGVFIHCGAIICATETLTYGSVLVNNRENVGILHLDSLEKRKQYNKKIMNMYEGLNILNSCGNSFVK